MLVRHASFCDCLIVHVLGYFRQCSLLPDVEFYYVHYTALTIVALISVETHLLGEPDSRVRVRILFTHFCCFRRLVNYSGNGLHLRESVADYRGFCRHFPCVVMVYI